MTATLELNSARRKLLSALGDKAPEYFRHMKSWFKKLSTKEEFDIEARKLLPASSSHLHNEFLLAILNKCQTLVSITSLPTSAVSALSPTKAASPSVMMSPTSAPTITMSSSVGSFGWRGVDGSDDGRLKYGPIKRKNKSSRQSFDQRFQPPALTNGLTVIDAGNLDLLEEERKLGFAVREPTLPDISLLHGRLLVSAWEHGLENGTDDDVVSLMVQAIEQFLKNLITSLLMDRNGYKLRDNRMPYAIGSETPNPWVINSQRRTCSAYEPPVVSDLVNSNSLNSDVFNGEDGELLPLVPIGHPPLRDVESGALVDVACATNFDGSATPIRQPVTLFDLLHTLQKNRKLIASHSVFAVNMERLISRLHHPDRED